MTDASIWDIRDKAPVVLPEEKGPEIIRGLPSLGAEIYAHERGVAVLSPAERGRYYRCMDTVDVIVGFCQRRLARK